MSEDKREMREALLEKEALEVEQMGDAFERMGTDEYELYLDSAGGMSRGEGGERM